MIYQEIIFKNLDNILQFWMLIDAQEQIVHWSKSAAHQLGYSTEEITNQPFTTLLPKGNAENLFFLKRLKEGSHSGSIVNQKARFQQKNGVLIDVELSTQILHQDHQEYLLLSFDNITEVEELQKLVNLKMKEIHQQVHAYQSKDCGDAIQDVLDAVLVSITAGQGLRFNRAFLLLVDEKSQTLEGIQAIGPESREKAWEIYQELRDAPKTLTEMIHYCHSQQIVHDNKVNQLVKKISLPLTEREHFLIHVLQDQKYQLINHEFSLFNTPSVRKIRELFQSDEFILVPMVWHGYSTGLILADNQIMGTPITNLHIQGLTRFTDTATNAIESMKLLVGLENSLHQVKRANIEIRENQTQIVQQEKLAAKGQLVTQMAHEVRGPLSIIGGFARRIFKQLKPEENFFDPLKRIVDTVHTLECVLNDILDDKQQKVIHQPYCDSVKLIHQVMGLLEEEIHQREISVNLNMQGDLPKVKIQEHHLFEIINNLIKNAIEAIDQKGLLSISVKRREQNVDFLIQDDGPGLTVTTMEKMFSPFFTTKEEGTGLGLVVVKKIIDEQGGSLDVTSFVGKGSTFKFSFPTI